MRAFVSSIPYHRTVRLQTKLTLAFVAVALLPIVLLGMVARLGVRDPDGLATQLSVLLDGAIAAALVRGESSGVRAAREAARTLLHAGGVRRTPSVAVPRPRARRRTRREGAHR